MYKSLFLLMVLDTIADVVWIASIIYIFVAEVLGETEAYWGYINTSFFIGMVVGGIICSRIARVFEKNLKYALISFSFVICILTFIFGLTKIAWLSLVFVGFIGIFQQLKEIASNTILQKSASTEELPKIYAVQSSLGSLLFAVSSLLFGFLSEIWGVQIIFIISAMLLGLSAIYAMVRHHRFSI